MLNYIEVIIVLYREKLLWIVGAISKQVSHLMESVATCGTHYRKEQHKWCCGKERIKTLYRNKRQLNNFSKREQIVAARNSVCVVLGKLPMNMHYSCIMSIFLTKRPEFSFFLTFLSCLSFLSLFTSLNSWVGCTFSSISVDSTLF